METRVFCKYILYILFSLMFFKSAYGQESQPSSKDQFSIDTLLHKAELVRTTNINEFNQYIDKLELYKVDFTQRQGCFFSYLLSIQKIFKGQYTLAKSDLQNLLKTCQNIENLIRIRATLSNMQAISSDYVDAINNLDYVLENLENIQDENLKLIVYSIASIVYRLVNQDKLSLKFSQLILNKNPSGAFICRALTNNNRIYIKQNDIKLNEDDVNRSIKVCEKNNELVYSNIMRIDWLSYKLLHSNNSQSIARKALSEIKKYETEIDATKYSNLISVKNSVLTKIYWQLHEYSHFLDQASLVLQNDVSIGFTKQRIMVLGLLINYYKKQNDYEKTLKYLELKSLTEKDYIDKQQAKVMAYQTVKHNNFAKTKEIEYLNGQNKLLSLEKDLTAKAAFSQKLVILFLLFLVGFILLWSIRNRKIQKMYKHLSETDNLTGIYNRKGFKDFAEDLLLQSKKEGRPVAMAIFDLDKFKRINDKYGHLKGDWTIKKTISQCQLVQNDKVTIGRIGGEEFAIVMRDSTSDELSEFVEECRIMIENIDSSSTGHDFVITASFGVTSTNASGYVYSKLLSDADHAMYDAKTSGRNMVINYKNNKI